MTTVPPTERPPGGVDPKLLEILVCPLTKHPRLKDWRVTKTWMASEVGLAQLPQ